MKLIRLFVVILLAAVATLSVPATAAQATQYWAVHLENINSGKCMAAQVGSGERPVFQTTCDFTVGKYWDDQRWSFTNVGENAIRRLASPQLCVVARGSGESAAVATGCANYADQKWLFLYTLGGAPDVYQIQNVNSGLCLAARGSGDSRVVQTTCDFNWPGHPYWADQYWWAG